MIDGHCHLNLKFKNCKTALMDLYQEATRARIEGMILVNIPGLQFKGEYGFENAEVIELAKEYKRFFHVFPTIRPRDRDAIKQLKSYKNSGVAGIKLHPRIHKYHIEDKACVAVVKEAGQLEMPVLICCFPDGIGLKMRNSPDAIGRLADKTLETKIAIGHAGGHKIIDSLMIAKACKNIYLDLSLSLLYYRGSSVLTDIAYAIDSIKGQRVYWGTDYPDRPYRETVEASISIFDRMDLENQIKERIFTYNVKEFLGEQL